MDKYNNLYEKLEKLKKEVDSAIAQIEDEYVKDYLKKYENNIIRLMDMTNSKSIKASNGGLLGVLRAISEYDDLSAIDLLYNAAYDVENYYSYECKNF